MHLKDYIRVLRTRWLLVATLSVAGPIFGVAVATLTPPTYQATAQLFVLVEGDSSVGDLNQGNAFAQSRVASYVSLATSPRVLHAVAREHGIDVGELQAAITATNPANTVLVNVRATAGTAEQAAKRANSAADVLVTVVNTIENTNLPHETGAAPVVLQKIQNASPPGGPFKPSLGRSVMVGVLFGFLAGALLALLVEAVDTRLRGRKEIRDVTDASVLGSFETAPKLSPSLILGSLHSFSDRVEGFRQLRTHLQFANVDQNVRSVLITSSVPGEGKSTVAANLSIVLADAGIRVLLIDADLRRPRQSTLFGLEGAVGLTTVLTGELPLHAATQPLAGFKNFDVLASGELPPNPTELLASSAMEHLVKAAEGSYDLVIIDSPPLVPVSDPSVLATLASGVLLVVAADGRVKRDQLRQGLETLRFVQSKVYGLVINFERPARKKAYYDYSSPAPTAMDR